jgi:AcrR family transcriptional regulator
MRQVNEVSLSEPPKQAKGENMQLPRQARADARRNQDALLGAATAVFITSGVDAPVREIAERAGVGVATLYRRFPKRSDLVAAVFCNEVDACAEDALALAAEKPPGKALALWLKRYTEFIATKRGLAAALRSGDPAFNSLPAYFRAKFEPALGSLLGAAADAGTIRAGVDPYDLLRAVGNLTVPSGSDGDEHTERMVALLIDGLKYGAASTGDARKKPEDLQ